MVRPSINQYMFRDSRLCTKLNLLPSVRCRLLHINCGHIFVLISSQITLLKILLASAPTAKAKTDSINILTDVLPSEMPYVQLHYSILYQLKQNLLSDSELCFSLSSSHHIKSDSDLCFSSCSSHRLSCPLSSETPFTL